VRRAAGFVVLLGIVTVPGAVAASARETGSLAPVRLTFRIDSSICIARADGTQRSGYVRLRSPRAISRASWSPKGKYAALLRGASGLVVVDEHGRVVRRVIRHFSYGSEDPVWSPDGRWIAVESGGHGPEIGIVPARGGDWDAWRKVWSPGDLESGGDSPTWTPDSRHLAFAAHLFRPPRVEEGVYTIGIDGTGLRLLVPDAVMPAYSPDGSQLAYVQGGDVWVSDADGANSRRLTTSGADARPAWSPRGRLIAFQRTVERHTSIYAVRPDGTGERVLVSSPRHDATMPSWRPATPFHGGPRRPCP
jgi:Tol biopolymer transport system component